MAARTNGSIEERTNESPPAKTVETRTKHSRADDSRRKGKQKWKESATVSTKYTRISGEKEKVLSGLNSRLGSNATRKCAWGRGQGKPRIDKNQVIGRRI